MIKKLPDCIISRISAGEVITSPANILKELIENSIDAEATKISVVLSPTLLSLSIADNGAGVRKDDLELMCQNHCTSKITTLEDLKNCGVISALCSFGFRGEALHSISVSSRLSITTRTRDDVFGYKAAYNGPEVLSMAKVAQEDAGTLVEVSDIFYRNKIRKDHFYKNKTECMACIDLVKSYGCIYSGIEMKVDNRIVLQRDYSHKRLASTGASTAFTAAQDQRPQPGSDASSGNISDDAVVLNKIKYIGRVFLSTEFDGANLEVEKSDQFLIICSNKYLTFKKCRCVFFINNRLVRNNVLKKRILDKYRGLIKEGTYPFVYIEMFVGFVDVNVHPSKSEVLVGDEQVFENVISAIENRLSNDEQYIPQTGDAKQALHVPGSEGQSGAFARPYVLSGSGAAGASSPCPTFGTSFPRSLSLQASSSQAFSDNDIKVYSSSQIRTIEESGSKRKTAEKSFSLISLKTLRSEVKEVDSSFFKTLVYVGCTDQTIFVQSHTMLIGIERGPFLRECFYMALLKEFGNLESEDIPPFETSVHESLHAMLQDYFGIRIRDGCVIGAPVLCGCCARDWTGFDVRKTTECETIRDVVAAVSAVYQNTELDQKRFNLIKNSIVGTKSLIERCKVFVALKDLYKKFGRC